MANQHTDNGLLSDEAKEALKPFSHAHTFRKGRLLWSEGDTEGFLVFLKSGQVKIYRLLPNGKAITLYVFGPGTVFGFMPLLDDAPYPAYAQALEDCQADVISRSELKSAVRAEPDLALLLMKHLAKRLRTAFDTIERLQSKGTDPKVASALAALADESVHLRQELIIIELPISAADFAQSLGLTPESFSRSITHLADKEIIKRLTRNRFQVLDLDALRKIAATVVY